MGESAFHLIRPSYAGRVHVSDFNWGCWDSAIGPTLIAIACRAEVAGFARLSVMDHFWQIPQVGSTEDPMLESCTTLGFLAAHTKSMTLYAGYWRYLPCARLAGKGSNHSGRIVR